MRNCAHHQTSNGESLEVHKNWTDWHFRRMKCEKRFDIVQPGRKFSHRKIIWFRPSHRQYSTINCILLNMVLLICAYLHTNPIIQNESSSANKYSLLKPLYCTSFYRLSFGRAWELFELSRSTWKFYAGDVECYVVDVREIKAHYVNISEWKWVSVYARRD